MNEKPRILVLTLSFGAGHIRAAEAIISELQANQPDARLQMIDALENCSLWFRAFYVWTYFVMIRFAPQLWKKFFHSRVQRRDEQTAPVWMLRKGCRKVFEQIKIFQPDLIVAAEVGACEIAVIARRKNLTNARIINVITDFEAEPIWVKPEIAAYAVASENVKNQLENWGANTEKIEVCGIPLSENFKRKHEANVTKSRFGLDERPIVLLMGGGMGPTRMDEVATRLLENGENLNIVAITGKDKSVRRKMAKLKNSETVNLRIFDWTDQVAALMQISAILVTKPGGLTLSEAAECGLPMIFFDAIPGPEESNAVRFADAGAGIQTYGSDETANEVLRLLRDRNKLSEMAKQSRKLAKPNAAKNIVKLILDEFEKAANVQTGLIIERTQKSFAVLQSEIISEVNAK